MCRLYNRDGEPFYVRLCYKTGRSGERVSWSEAGNFVDESYSDFGGCVYVAALIRDRLKSGLSEDGRILHLRIPATDADIYSDSLREILRWQLEGTRANYAESALTLERDEPWLDLREILARAASFGWKPNVS